MANTELDALVVGGGPVGMLAAIELAARGCKVRIIDALDAIEIKTKASAVHARSMEVLPAPVSDNIFKHSNMIQQFRLNETDNQGKPNPIAVITLEGIPVYKGTFAQTQWKTEEMLQDHLQSLPDHFRGGGAKMRVERSTEFVDCTDKGDQGVECQLRSKDGAVEMVVAKYLVGADGGKSGIRKKLGLSFSGEATHEYFFALHAGLDNYSGDPQTLDLFFSRGENPLAPGFAFTVPMPDGGFLVTCDLDPEQQKLWMTGERDSHGWPILRQPDAKDVIAVLRERGCGQQLELQEGTVKWVAHFRVQSRQAEFYRKGRVLIAGDACHCHSPLGGQGMNMGFLDSKNLAWKLATAVKYPGPGTSKLLDTYDEERRTLEKKICAGIEAQQKMASNRNPVVFFMRGRGQRLIQHLGSITSAGSKVLSQQAWGYNSSPLSQEHWERPPVSCCPITTICPAGGYRRRQNIFRWTSKRTRCGERPPLEAVTDEGELLEKVLKRSRGWTLLLFEGTREANDDLSRHVRDVSILSAKELALLGVSMRMEPDSTDYVGGIDEVVVFSAEGPSDAHSLFGVKAQCLYLIRPDMHVGLRCEPVREGAVYNYFSRSCGLSDMPSKPYPQPSGNMDLLPAFVWVGISLLVLAALVFGHGEPTTMKIILAVALIICFLVVVMQCLGARWAASAAPQDTDPDKSIKEPLLSEP